MKKINSVIINIFICFILSFNANALFASTDESKSCKFEPLKKVSEYSLIDSMLWGRSRRFFKGATMPGVPLAMQSSKLPERLSLQEEALMAFAGAGITGYVAADLPYQPANAANEYSGGGNVMVQLVGRTFASGDSAQLVTLLVINDDGVWLVRRPQDLSASETEQVIKLGREHKWVEAYELLRVKIKAFTEDHPRKMFEMPRIPQLTATFNMWSVNQPGTTYFLPIIDYSSIYMTVAFHLLSPELGVYLIDDRNRNSPAGIAQYVHIPNIQPEGWLNANPEAMMTNSIGNVEMMAAQFAAVELGGLLQNMRLMAQALGLGGFPNYAGTPGVWGKILGFEQEMVKMSKLMGLPGMPYDYDYPVDLALKDQNGRIVLKAWTPPNFNSSGYETAKAYAQMKFGENGQLKSLEKQSAWKDQEKVKSQIPVYSSKLIEALGSHIDYVYKRYGRFPAITGPLGHLSAFQAHVLDADFYTNYYKEGILSDTQRCRSE